MKVARGGIRCRLDGISWRGHQLNGHGSWMVFRDRVVGSDVTAGAVMLLLSAGGFGWLVAVCRPMTVGVVPLLPL